MIRRRIFIGCYRTSKWNILFGVPLILEEKILFVFSTECEATNSWSTFTAWMVTKQQITVYLVLSDRKFVVQAFVHKYIRWDITKDSHRQETSNNLMWKLIFWSAALIHIRNLCHCVLVSTTSSLDWLSAAPGKFLMAWLVQNVRPVCNSTLWLDGESF